MISLNSKKSFPTVLLVVVLIILGVGLGFYLAREKSSSASPYSAVYLSSGDVYFGRLSWFPWPRLQNVWYLDRQVNPQTQATELSLAPLSGTFWQPINEIRINPKEIVFWTKLKADSQVAQALAQSEKGTTTLNPENNLPSTQNGATSTPQ